MSSLWYQANGCADPTWRSVEIDAEVLDLRATLDLPLRVAKLGGVDGTDKVALLVAPVRSAWINGSPVVGGLAILAHRDELLIGGRALWYSDESVPVKRTFASTSDSPAPRCPVCRRDVRDGESIVQCPRCRRIFHQIETSETDEAKLCWTYRPTCLCSHPTETDPEAVWRPEKELDDDHRLAS